MAFGSAHLPRFGCLRGTKTCFAFAQGHFPVQPIIMVVAVPVAVVVAVAAAAVGVAVVVVAAVDDRDSVHWQLWGGRLMVAAMFDGVQGQRQWTTTLA